MSEQKPVLYGYCRSSATWRVRIALEIKGIEYDNNIINLLKKEQNSEEYKKISPSQKVPAFVTKEGKVLTQSEAIIEYIEETYPGRSLLPKDAMDRAIVRELCQIVACDIHPLQNLSVLTRVGGDDVEKQSVYAREVITKGFTALEARLSKVAGPNYCVGNSLTMADLFVIPMIGNATRRNVDMSQFPILSRLNESLSALPEFQKAQPSSQPDWSA